MHVLPGAMQVQMKPLAYLRGVAPQKKCPFRENPTKQKTREDSLTPTVHVPCAGFSGFVVPFLLARCLLGPLFGFEAFAAMAFTPSETHRHFLFRYASPVAPLRIDFVTRNLCSRISHIPHIQGRSILSASRRGTLRFRPSRSLPPGRARTQRGSSRRRFATPTRWCSLRTSCCTGSPSP